MQLLELRGDVVELLGEAESAGGPFVLAAAKPTPMRRAAPKKKKVRIDEGVGEIGRGEWSSWAARVVY